MALDGIEAITFGVADMDAAKRFLVDFGLTPIGAERDVACFATQSGAEVFLRPLDGPGLPPAMEPGPTLREVIWGAPSSTELKATLENLAQGCNVETGADGMPRCTDPNGLRLGFRVSRRRAVNAAATPVNAPGSPLRVDRASPIYEQATPLSIGHIVLFVGDLAPVHDFYVERLGFVLSDRYPGAASFLRCRPRGAHHNLFLLERKGKPGLNHVAFTVRDIHEMFGGGLAMSRKGWETDIGPGRHPISSAYFWYLRSPCGGSLEYFADEDYLTEAWQPRDFARTPENFVEWAVAGGIDGKTRRQKRSS